MPNLVFSSHLQLCRSQLHWCTFWGFQSSTWLALHFHGVFYPNPFSTLNEQLQLVNSEFFLSKSTLLIVSDHLTLLVSVVITLKISLLYECVTFVNTEFQTSCDLRENYRIVNIYNARWDLDSIQHFLSLNLS